MSVVVDRSRWTIAQLVHLVETERPLHLVALAAGLDGGRPQARESARTGNAYDQAVVKLLDRLRAEGLA